MRKALVILCLSMGCGRSVTFNPLRTTGEPFPETSYGHTDAWSLREGAAVALTMQPKDAHVTFVADDDTVVRVHETSAKGTFIVMPLAPGKTILHARGDSAQAFSVDVRAQ